MKTLIVTGGLAATGALMVLVATTMGQAETEAYLDAETVASGSALYGKNCASCHGAKLEGQPNWRDRDAQGYLPAPPHDETGHTWHHPTAQLFQITKFGTEAIVGGGYRSNMPGFSTALTDPEIEAVLAFIKSTWPDHIIKRHTQMDAARN